MEGFIGVRGVLPARLLRELSQRSDVRGALQTASHFGAIGLATAGLALTWGSWWALPFFLVQGVLINMLYAAEHELYHGTAFKTRRLNDWFARLCGFWVIYPSDFDKWQHFAHHRHTQDWERDTELLRRKPFTSPWQYLWTLSGLPYFYYRTLAIVRHARGRAPESFLTEDQRRGVIVSARWHLAGYAAIAVSAVALESWWPVVYWLGPMVATKWVYYLQGLGEHTGLTHAPHTLQNTRTFKTNAFLRWAHWNMVYHTVHHTFTNVPFHRLAELHREVTARYPHRLPEVGYIRCHAQILRELFRGRTEHDIVAEADARYARLAREPRAAAAE
ncbi:MAG: fatty acid desaturase [Alphaproteobacteria bacterium]